LLVFCIHDVVQRCLDLRLEARWDRVQHICDLVKP
jgi:hypothetical protein